MAKRRGVSDGDREVVILNGGRMPHTDEALIVYGDTFRARDRLIPMNQFARWLIASKLPVERIYGTHMVGYATMLYVRQVLR